jgi:hypothetical protein
MFFSSVVLFSTKRCLGSACLRCLFCSLLCSRSLLVVFRVRALSLFPLQLFFSFLCNAYVVVCSSLLRFSGGECCVFPLLHLRILLVRLCCTHVLTRRSPPSCSSSRCSSVPFLLTLLFCCSCCLLLSVTRGWLFRYNCVFPIYSPF